MPIRAIHSHLRNNQLIRFILVGALNTLFSYAIYAAGIWFGLEYYEASLVGLIIGILFSFKTQGALVFGNSDNRLILLFAANWALIYACMIGVIALLMRAGLNEYWAGLLALPPVAGLSFLSQKFIVFNARSRKPGVNSALVSDAESSLPLYFYIANYRFFLRRLLLRNGYGEIRYGVHSYGIPILRWWGDAANLNIGKYCSIGKNVRIFLGGNHRSDWITTYPFPAFSNWRTTISLRDCTSSHGNIAIGNDAWLGEGSIILSGVTIGNGAVVGAGAVVTKDVPDYSIVAGNPARLVRKRFSDEQIVQLNRISWWNWDNNKVQNNIPLLLSGNIQEFIKQHLDEQSPAIAACD